MLDPFCLQHREKNDLCAQEFGLGLQFRDTI